jgi:chemotaxis protein CheX
MAASRATGRAPRPNRRVMKDLLKPVGLDAPEKVALPPVLGLPEAGPLREQLLAMRGRPIELDGSKVERIGALGLQVLLSARATWQADGHILRLADLSDPLRQGLELLGARDLDTNLSQE